MAIRQVCPSTLPTSWWQLAKSIGALSTRAIGALGTRSHSFPQEEAMNAESRKRPAHMSARKLTAAALTALIVSGGVAGAVQAATPAPLPGAVWMTDNEGSHLNQNLYTSKGEVWVSGAPDNQGPLPTAATSCASPTL